LVVDDEAPILHALQRTFEAAGYEVNACADPAEALDRLREKPFQVLSADYMMPGMTGAEFLAQAKSLQPETIRILLTAAHDFSAAVDAVNNGEIFRILAKPWNRVELLGTVRQAFDTCAMPCCSSPGRWTRRSGTRCGSTRGSGGRCSSASSSSAMPA